MPALPLSELAQPPRLLRAAGMQVMALMALALLAELPWPTAEPRAKPERPPARAERRVRIVQLPRAKPPAPRPPQPQQARAEPKPPAPQAPREPPRAARAEPAPTRTEKPAPVVHARIAADSTAVQGVRLRVLVPREPRDLAAHLRNSGGCLVVSRLSGGSAEVLTVLGLSGDRAIEEQGPPCDGTPRLLRDPALNLALGDPLGRVQAGLAPSERRGEVVLQVLLAGGLHGEAQSALRARFGAVPMEEMARQAAASGYELTCFAETSGSVRCE